MKNILIVLLLAVISSQTVLAQDIYYRVTANSLNVRYEPDSNSRVKGQLRKGDNVKLLEKTTDDWYYVEAGNTKGYISSQYIEPLAIESESVGISKTTIFIILAIIVFTLITYFSRKIKANKTTREQEASQDTTLNFKSSKNRGLAVLLCIIFPYFGLLYSSVKGFLFWAGSLVLILEGFRRILGIELLDGFFLEAYQIVFLRTSLIIWIHYFCSLIAAYFYAKRAH